MIKRSMITAILLLAAMPAEATTLLLDTGWQGDQTGAVGAPSNNSPWTFTIANSAYFRVTDAFVVGDIYQVTDSSSTILGTTTFTTDGAIVPGYFGTSWSDTSYSRLSLLLTPGSYALAVSGNCAGGCPAGLAVRLDSLPMSGTVPEPASWALLIAGFGLTGAALRRRRFATVSVAA